MFETSFFPLSSIIWTTFLLAAAVFFVCAWVEELRRPRNLPPTPGNRRPFPFIGRAFDLPKERSWVKFREWSEKYGPLLTVWDGNVPTILVGDPEIATELLAKRSQKYSSRPRSVVAGDLLTQNKNILFTTYGDKWRGIRRALHQGTMNKAVESYLPVFVMEGQVLTAAFLRNPEDWYNQIFRYTASSVVVIAFGRRISDIKKDVACQKLEATSNFMIKMNVPGAYGHWHELFPLLQYVPSALNFINREALGFRKIIRENQSSLLDEVRRKVAAGIAPHSYARSMLGKRDSFPELDDAEFNGAPGSFFSAGVNTTSSTLQSLVLAMVLHPEIQAKAHEEIDRVVGTERSPTWEDEKQMPYVCAIIKEVLRWRPVGILCAPHSTTEDDYYVLDGKEYFIPKGAQVLASLWTINNCRRIYSNPDQFDPERFLNGRQYPGTGNKGHCSFGWGRRVCPGAYFAERSLFHTSARMLWAFKFSRTRAKTGEWITPDSSIETGYTSAFNVRPQPFPCTIDVRSPAIEEIIRVEEKEALEGLKQFE